MHLAFIPPFLSSKPSSSLKRPRKDVTGDPPGGLITRPELIKVKREKQLIQDKQDILETHCCQNDQVIYLSIKKINRILDRVCSSFFLPLQSCIPPYTICHDVLLIIIDLFVILCFIICRNWEPNKNRLLSWCFHSCQHT